MNPPDALPAEVVCRFAPSPTGFLHVGGARTALYNWLLARRHRGKYVLRIEDTDLARSTQQAVDQLLEDLAWLGLNHDNRHSLMFQSQRLAVYNAAIDRLIAEGKAYKAYETPDELDALRKAAEREKRAFIYRRRPGDERNQQSWETEGRPHVVRFAMPVRDYAFEDLILGPIRLPADQVDDFVIRKADGMPTYHFAVVVDDAEMGITHVIRGQEHTLNTFKHIGLQEALGFARPRYAHLPVILNKDDGKKMGKRDRDKKIRAAAVKWLNTRKQGPELLALAAGLPAARIAEWLARETVQLDLAEQSAVMPVVGLRETDLPEILVHDFRKNGYLPEALLNFLALLGWNPGGDRERMTVQEMIELFDLKGVNKAGARFDRDKLLAFNTAAIAAASVERLLAALKDFVSCNETPLSRADDGQLQRLIALCAGFRTFRDLDDKARSLLLADHEIRFDPDAVERVLLKNNGEGAAALREIASLLETLDPFDAPRIEAALKDFAEARRLTLGKVAQPLRVAVTGGAISPSIGATLEFLGQASTLTRVRRCLGEVERLAGAKSDAETK